MESSIAVFLLRQPACERLPTINAKRPTARECVETTPRQRANQTKQTNQKQHHAACKCKPHNVALQKRPA
jgi:hypothetical protein